MLKLAVNWILRAMAVRQAKYAAMRGLVCVGAGIVIAVLVLTALGCLTAALWIYLGRMIGPAAAPAITAGVLLVIAGFVALLTRLSGKRRRRADAAADLEGLAASLPFLMRKHGMEAIAAALILGIVSGTRRRR